MSFTQTRFCNSTVRSFSASAGWGGDQTRLEVNLVDDPLTDGFLGPQIGSPQLFQVGNWFFAGIVERWSTSSSIDGSPLYTVSLNDPGVLLDGVHVILSSYTGSTNNVPNLINVYGALESISFGYARKTESGISWGLVKEAIDTLGDGIISFAGYRYNIDFSLMPVLPDDFKIGFASASMMEIIREVCDAASCDFFVRLLADLRTIQIVTISRANRPLNGIIAQYVAQTQDAKVKEIGFEMVNEINSKFLIGANKLDMFYTFSGTGDRSWNTPNDNMIWPYWGVDAEGRLIIGSGLNNEHTFTLDSRAVLVPGIGNTYPTDVGELRAALSSQLDWESYLCLNTLNKYRIDPDGDETDNMYIFNGRSFVSGGQQYKHSGVRNPHFLKIKDFAYTGAVSMKAISDFINSVDAASNRRLLKKINAPLIPIDNQEKSEEYLTTLYNLVKDYAGEYYGRKFMVRLPDIEWYKDQETDNVFLSYEIAEAGFVSEDQWANGVARNLLPPDINRVLTSDGRIEAFVRFDDIANLDLSQVSPDDVIFGNNLRKRSGTRYEGTQSAFVKCTVNPDFIYLDRNTGDSPRAIVELSGPVLYKESSNIGGSIKIIVDFINRVWPTLSDNNPNAGFTDEAKEDILNGFYTLTSLGNGKMEKLAAIPNVAVVPLQSNVSTYGPWYAAGADGKCVFEQDDTLAPWNYGGNFNYLDAVAYSMMADVGYQQYSEYGRVEVPGGPVFNLGDQLLAVGPYVTDIQVSLDESQGATTSYSFKLWTPRFDKLAVQWRERIARISRRDQKNRMQIRDLLKYRGMKK